MATRASGARSVIAGLVALSLALGGCNWRRPAPAETTSGDVAPAKEGGEVPGSGVVQGEKEDGGPGGAAVTTGLPAARPPSTPVGKKVTVAVPTGDDIAAAARIIPVSDDEGTIHYGSADGPSYTVQFFAFDKEKKTAAAASGGFRLQAEGIPVPVLMSPSAGTFSLGGTMSAVYADTLWDVKGYRGLLFGVLKSVSGATLASIELRPPEDRKVYLSSDYVFFTLPDPAVPGDGPYACLVFNWKRIAGDLGQGAVLSLSRNGTPLARESVNPEALFEFTVRAVEAKDDVVEWRIQSADGTVTHQGELGFPVSASAPTLVCYIVNIR